jgi:hypothetical protein
MVKLANEDVHWEDPGIYPDKVRENRDFLAHWVRHLLRAVPDLEVKVVVNRSLRSTDRASCLNGQ